MATNPTLLTMPIAENGQKNTIPATQAAAGDGLLSQSTGFPPETALPLGAGGKAPTREDFNGAFNLLSDIAFYSQKGWTFQYDATQAYYKGCIVMDSTDGKRYECINDVAAGTILPSADTDNDYWREYSPGGVPLGTILIQSADAPEPPYGFLYAEGQAVSRTMYADYFALVGTKYGSGDGETTFNLPNPLNRYFQFTQTAGTVKSAGLPNIEGKVGRSESGAGLVSPFYGIDASEGAFGYSKNTFGTQSASSSGQIGQYITFDASKSNPIYGNSDTVTPPTITFRAIVKVYDAPTPSSAQIDLSQYASDLAARLTREQTPAFNRRDVITTSGTYVAPVTGWYKITVKGGGGGGQGGGYITNTSAFGGHGGGEGGTTIAYEKMTAGQSASVVIGAGGAGGAISSTGFGSSGANGGNSTVTVNTSTYTGDGGQGGGMGSGSGGNGTIVGAPGGTESVGAITYQHGGAGGGAGGGYPTHGTMGGGGAGGLGRSASDTTAGYEGGDGYAEFSYFDPTLM